MVNYSLFLTSLWVGIVFCAPPGAITAEAIRRGAARGFRPALLVEFGSLVGDATWAALALLGLAFVVQNAGMQAALALVGAGLLLYLARSALKDAHAATAQPGALAFLTDLAWGGLAVVGLVWLIQGAPATISTQGGWLPWVLGAVLFVAGWQRSGRAVPHALPQAHGGATGSDFATGAALSLGNPWNIVFWVGIGAKQLAALENPQWSDHLTFFSGFMAGAVVWCFFMAGLIGFGRRFVTPTFFRRVNLVCGLLLGFFALQLLAETFRR